MTILATGAATNQVVGIVGSVAVARVYSPRAVGDFGEFASWVILLSMVATLRLDDALGVCRASADGPKILRTGCLTAIAVAILVLCGQLILASGQQSPEVWPMALLPIAVLLTGANQMLAGYRLWQHDYRGVASIQAGRSLWALASKLLLGLIVGPFGYCLALGHAAGEFIVLLRGGVRLRGRQVIKIVSPMEAWRVIQEHWDFTVGGTVQALIGASWLQLPAMLMGSTFGKSAVGYYSLAMVLCQSPLLILNSSLRQAFMREAATSWEGGRPLFARALKLTCYMVLFYMAPAVVLVVYGQDLAGWVYGDEWRPAGEVASMLAWSCWVSSGKVPSLVLARLAKLQVPLLKFDGAALVLELVLFGVLTARLSFSAVMWLHVLVMAFYNIATMSYVMHAVRRRDRSLGL